MRPTDEIRWACTELDGTGMSPISIQWTEWGGVHVLVMPRELLAWVESSDSGIRPSGSTKSGVSTVHVDLYGVRYSAIVSSTSTTGTPIDNPMDALRGAA